MKRSLLILCVLCAAVARSSAVQRAGDPAALELHIGFAQPDGRYRVETMPLETYVARVVAGEAARDSPPAALEALAITVRTFALANRDRHQADGFDLCDQTHCQVVRAATPATERAARATAGQVLMQNGVVAQVFYSASCGGRTEIPSDVWPGADDPPYLPSIEDEACNGAPAWQAELSSADLLRALQAAGFRGDRLTGVRIASRNQAGRVAELALEGLTPGRISGQDLRMAVARTLGASQQIKSTAFEIERAPRGYRFSGHGSGHGVGLCVIGSVNRAAHGATPQAILAVYFPGLVIASAGPRLVPETPRLGPAPAIVTTVQPDIRVSLPAGDEGERGAIADLAARAREQLARTLGVDVPAPLTLRFHATTDDYERATGQPWFTSATVVARGGVDELHFLPLAVLRQRGVLDRTIRYELVHLMVDPFLEQRPAWVREGAAMYFADQPMDASGAAVGPLSDGRVSCPDDAELERPVSVGALSNALTRARACFARQMARGRAWRDVR